MSIVQVEKTSSWANRCNFTKVGCPVGGPSTLALSRLRREGIPALCRRPMPFERGQNGHSKRTPVPRNLLLKNSTPRKEVDWMSTLLSAMRHTYLKLLAVCIVRKDNAA